MNDNEIKALLKKKYEMLSQKGYREYERLEDIWHQKTGGKYVADFILGANDGVITTFVVVAAAIGASLDPFVVVILGVANLLGDGASMAFGNYLGKKSEADYQRGQRKKEDWEIDNFPAIETQEVREIFEKWGFAGEDLDRATQVIISDRKAWLDIMMKEELGILEEDSSKPFMGGLVTFVAFVIAGAIPLVPFLVPAWSGFTGTLSAIFAALSLFVVGALRTKITPQNWFKGGLEVLGVGGVAAVLAYIAGVVVEKFIN